MFRDCISRHVRLAWQQWPHDGRLRRASRGDAAAGVALLSVAAMAGSKDTDLEVCGDGCFVTSKGTCDGAETRRASQSFSPCALSVLEPAESVKPLLEISPPLRFLNGKAPSVSQPAGAAVRLSASTNGVARGRGGGPLSATFSPNSSPSQLPLMPSRSFAESFYSQSVYTKISFSEGNFSASHRRRPHRLHNPCDLFAMKVIKKNHPGLCSWCGAAPPSR